MSKWNFSAFLVLAALLVAAAAAEAASKCTSDAQCDDGIFCNGAERCPRPGVPGVGCTAGTPPCDPATECNETFNTCGIRCTRDVDCDNGTFCDGAERCQPGTPGADLRGCLPPLIGACAAGQTCDETGDRCLTRCDLEGDADGDGVLTADCGGSDCDDNDANRFPGNRETCDANDVDEDCDPETFGVRDGDRDLFADNLCCNVESTTGKRHCGNDCNDLNEAIRPGSMTCSTTNQGQILVCENGEYATLSCATGRLCSVLENGTGICLPQSATP